MAPFAHGDTTLRAGVPNAPSNSTPVSYESVSTSQIDAQLSALTTQFPAQYQYPANFTTNKAEAAFQELADLKASLQSNLVNVIEASSNVKQVYYINAYVDPLKATFSQQGTSIGLTISQMELTARIEAETQGGIIGGIFCPTPNVTVDVEGLKAHTSYNVYTGAISGVYVTYSNIDAYNASCGGILGIVGDIFVALLGLDGLAEDAVADMINDINGIGNKYTLFSVRDFMEGMLDSNKYTSAHAGKVLTTMDEIIMQTDLDSGLVLDIEVDDSANNRVSFVARQATPRITNIEYTLNNIILDVYIPPSTEKVEIYALYPGNTTWTYQKSTTLSGVVLGTYDVGTKFVAVAKSDLISGLYSLPSNIKINYHDFYSGGGGQPL